VVGALGVGVLYGGALAGFAIYDLVQVANGERVSPGFAKVEGALSVPVVLGFGVYAGFQPSQWKIWAPGLLLSGGVLAHALWTLDAAPAQPRPPPLRAVSVAPFLGEGQAGLALAGRF
jgi:hypothetical protein